MSFTEYRTEKAIVRIHPGKLTDEERKAAFENGATKSGFLRAVQKANQNKKIQNVVG